MHNDRSHEEHFCATRDRTEHISFAVELKFLLRHSRDSLSDPSVRPFVPHLPVALRNSMTHSELQVWRDRWEAIAEALNTLPHVNALTSSRIQKTGLGHTDYWKTHWLVYKSNSAVPSYVTFQNNDPDFPLLDPSFPDYGNHVWTPVEVCSPVLHWSARKRDGHDSENGALRVLRTVLETINSGQCGAVLGNHSTETHVHFGRLDGRFLSISTMKRLATLAWLSEPILRGVKDPKSPNVDHVYTWSSPLRSYSRLGMALGIREGTRAVSDGGCGHGPGDEELLATGDIEDFTDFVAGVSSALIAAKRTTTGLNVHENGDGDGDGLKATHLLDNFNRRALKMIWRAGNHQELGKMLSGSERKYRRLGFNFHSLVQEEQEVGSKTSPRTIEFRFLEGFVDTQVVLAWVKLCGEMVALAAGQVENGEFYSVVAALLLILPEDSPLDVKFRAFADVMGQRRIPKSVWEPLQAVIRKNYPTV